MKENIEIKDVQRTEYLDKNGLDMLWAMVKENTHNQVEVEYNRAKAKEDSLSQEIASVKPSEGKVFLQAEATEDAKILKDDLLSFGDYRTGIYAGVAAKGFFVQKDTEEVEVSSTGIKADVERESDTKVWNTNGGITDLTNYAKKTDIPEIDTSDFVSKTTTDAQIINSILGIIGGGIQMIDYTADSDPVSLELSSSALTFDGCDRSTITLNASDVNSNNGSRIIIEAYNENPNITLQSNVGSDFAFNNNLTITNEGISNSDNNANHVYATDGSIADLTQYAKKNEITAGGNIDDVQVNGVSVVENKIANIKPATKESVGVVKVGDGLNVTDGTISVDSTAIGAGNYIPYARYERGEYIMLNNIRVEGSRTGNDLNSSIGHNGLSVYKMVNNGIHSNIQCAEIELQSDKNRVRINDDGIDIWKLDVHAELGVSDYLLGLSKRGIRLYGGDDNHVLTSNASTIDITQYVLKSVYDEKIAALEARIAALEAKHTETA